MEVKTEELLGLLSDRVKEEMARTEIEQQRLVEIKWLFRQQKYLLATMQEYFDEMSERIQHLEDVVLNSSQRVTSLRLQLSQYQKSLNRMEEEKSKRGGELSIMLDGQIDETKVSIQKLTNELEKIKSDKS